MRFRNPIFAIFRLSCKALVEFLEYEVSGLFQSSRRREFSPFRSQTIFGTECFGNSCGGFFCEPSSSFCRLRRKLHFGFEFAQFFAQALEFNQVTHLAFVMVERVCMDCLSQILPSFFLEFFAILLQRENFRPRES
jgi:hypothetical protein